MMPRETAAQREAREEQERIDALAAQTQGDAEANADVTGVDLSALDDYVNVPKEAGDEIVLSRGVDVIGRYKVEGGRVHVKDPEQRAMLLASVPGAHV